MAAVAREFPPPRLAPPRPTPKSVPPPLPHATAVNADELVDVSDTAVHELIPEHVPPAVAAAAALEHGASAAHPGAILVRTLGFFVMGLAGDGVRFLRAYVKAHWVRASARARG